MCYDCIHECLILLRHFKFSDCQHQSNRYTIPPAYILLGFFLKGCFSRHENRYQYHQSNIYAISLAYILLGFFFFSKKGVSHYLRKGTNINLPIQPAASGIPSFCCANSLNITFVYFTLDSYLFSEYNGVMTKHLHS